MIDPQSAYYLACIVFGAGFIHTLYYIIKLRSERNEAVERLRRAVDNFATAHELVRRRYGLFHTPNTTEPAIPDRAIYIDSGTVIGRKQTLAASLDGPNVCMEYQWEFFLALSGPGVDGKVPGLMWTKKPGRDPTTEFCYWDKPYLYESPSMLVVEDCSQSMHICELADDAWYALKDRFERGYGAQETN